MLRVPPMSEKCVSDFLSGIGSDKNDPSSKMGLGHPPNEESNPLRLKINFMTIIPGPRMREGGVLILGRFQQRSLHCIRYRDRNEPGCRIQIILTALIYYSKVPICCGIFVWQHSIDLVQLQRGWIILVVDANDKLQCGFFGLFHSFNPSIAFFSCPFARCRELRTSVIRQPECVHSEAESSRRLSAFASGLFHSFFA